MKFLGDIPDAHVRREYQDASVFVLTPEQHGLAFEGFGLVYLEAGAYGLPVVATRTGGVADAVRHGETGLLAAAGEVEQVAECLLRVLRDPDLAARLGRGNRDWSERLSWERFAAAQREVYERILG